MRLLYSWLMRGLVPVLKWRLSQRARQEPGYEVAVAQRWGHYTAPAQPGAVWVHAVSLGETRTAQLLVAALRRHWPGMRLLLTHGTATGRAQGAAMLQPGDQQVWLPWDTPDAVAGFLSHFQPCLGLLMETEVWPNLVHSCQQQGMPLVLVNARMNEASFAKALRLRALSQPAYAGLAGIWAQTEADAQRLRALGGQVNAVVGNMKFDAQPDQAQHDMGRWWRTHAPLPVVVLASSREGEEAALLAALRADTAALHAAQWLIVPRHPQRFDAVAELMGQAGWSVSRRSSWTNGPPAAQGGPPTLWLGDSMGDMALYFGLSQLALLGGSFERLGGQNLIEAMAGGCAVVMGPHTYNFAQAAYVGEQAGAAFGQADMPSAVRRVVCLLNQPSVLQAAQASALQVARQHQGAAEQTARALTSLLPAPTGR